MTCAGGCEVAEGVEVPDGHVHDHDGGGDAQDRADDERHRELDEDRCRLRPQVEAHATTDDHGRSLS